VPHTSAQAIVSRYPTFAALSEAWDRSPPHSAAALLAGLVRETSAGRAVGPKDSALVHRFFTRRLEPGALIAG
jgi:hypothetical protein